jgi:pantothenate synthetase
MLNGLEPDYVELVQLDGATLLAAAVRIGDTRLIDNVILEGELS